MSKNAVVTIISKNYMPFAITLRDSVLSSNDVDFFTFVIDGDKSYKDTERSKVISPNEVAIKHFYQRALYFDITEFNTSVKPDVILHLFNEGYESVIYLDPDIKVYSSLKNIYEKLESDCDFFLTPHILEPIKDDKFPSEIDILKTGIYNLGFIGCNVRGKNVIEWWSSRLEVLGFNDTASGLFTDQKWIDLLPALSDKVYISYHRGMNAAYWNLHERRIFDVGGTLFANEHPLVFFHFSGIDVKNPENISKYQNRFSLSSRNDIKPIFREYASEVIKNTNELHLAYQYKYNYMFDRYIVNELTRRLYKRFLDINPEKIDSNPFTDTSSDSFIAWLIKNRLTELGSAKRAWEEEKVLHKAEDLLKSTYKRQFAIVSKVFRFLRRFLGEKRYSELLKVLTIISNTRRGTIIYDEKLRQR